MTCNGTPMAPVMNVPRNIEVLMIRMSFVGDIIAPTGVAFRMIVVGA